MIQPIDIGIIVGYVVIVFLLGLWSARKQSPEAFLAHERNLTTFPFITTVSASWVGGGAIVAYGAYVYMFGIAAVSLYFGVLLSMLFFAYYAPRLREEGFRHKHLTLADYFFVHFGRRAGFVSAVVMGFVFFLFIINQFIAGSTVLATLTGWSYGQALFGGAAIVTIYLLLGGMKSVVKTDIFQYIVMFILLVVLGVSMVSETGVEPQLLRLTNMSPFLMLAFVLYGLLVPFCSAEIWQRVFIAKSNAVARRGLIGAGVCVLIFGIAITLLGLAAKTAYPAISPKEAIPYGMAHLLSPGFLGLGLAVLFAAIMSSVDTLVFYLSSSIAKDFFGRMKTVTGAGLQRITKFSIFAVVGLTVLGAFFFRDIIAVLLTVAGMQVGFVPPLVASFHMKLKQNAVCASLILPCIYVLGLIVFDLMIPELAMVSVFISALTLWLWQKFGK